MAAGIFNRMLAQNQIEGITADSAGIYAQDGSAASENAIKAAYELGADIHMHRSKRLTEQLVQQNDVLYAMTPQHKSMIETAYPKSRGKVFLIGSGIDDPFGGDLDVYRKCRNQIKDALEFIIKGIKQNEKN
jgi:protein-tyrosine phosphatase